MECRRATISGRESSRARARDTKDTSRRDSNATNIRHATGTTNSGDGRRMSIHRATATVSSAPPHGTSGHRIANTWFGRYETDRARSVPPACERPRFDASSCRPWYPTWIPRGRPPALLASISPAPARMSGPGVRVSRRSPCLTGTSCDEATRSNQKKTPPRPRRIDHPVRSRRPCSGSCCLGLFRPRRRLETDGDSETRTLVGEATRRQAMVVAPIYRRISIARVDRRIAIAPVDHRIAIAAVDRNTTAIVGTVVAAIVVVNRRRHVHRD